MALYSYGLCKYGLYSYGLCKYGLYSHGLYRYGLYSYRRTLESKGVLLFKKGVSMMEVDVKYRDNKHWNLEGRSCCS